MPTHSDLRSSGTQLRPEDVLGVACEVRLVQEFASMGTLRECLDSGALCSGGNPDVRIPRASGCGSWTG